MFDILTELELSEEGRCSNLLLSIKIEVAYALQGSLANPQAKIVGVLLTEGPPRLSPDVFCLGPFCPTTREDEIELEKEIAGESGSGDSKTGDQVNGETTVSGGEEAKASKNNEMSSDDTVPEGSGSPIFVAPQLRSRNTIPLPHDPPLKPVVNANSNNMRIDDPIPSGPLRDGRYPSSKTVSIQLSTTVTFLDITEPSEPVFPDPPRLNLKLPPDFFYPFLSSSQGRVSVTWKCYLSVLSAVFFSLLFV